MITTTTKTVRREDETGDRCGQPAGVTRAPVEDNDWRTREIQAGLREADDGDFASEEEVVALARKWQASPR